MEDPDEVEAEVEPEAASGGRGSRWKKRALVVGALGLAALAVVAVAVGLKADNDEDSHDLDHDDDGVDENGKDAYDRWMDEKYGADDEELDVCEDCGEEDCVCHDDGMCSGCGEIVCECDADDDDTTCPHCDGIEGMQYCPECHRVDDNA